MRVRSITWSLVQKSYIDTIGRSFKEKNKVVGLLLTKEM